MAQPIRVRLHRTKAYTKAKTIKEQAIDIKENNSNIKKNSLSLCVNRSLHWWTIHSPSYVVKVNTPLNSSWLFSRWKTVWFKKHVTNAF